MDEFVTNLVLPMYFIILGVNDEVRSYNFYFWSYKVFMKKNIIWFILSMRAKIPKIKNCERYAQILLRTPPHRDIFNDDVTLNKCRGKNGIFLSFSSVLTRYSWRNSLHNNSWELLPCWQAHCVWWRAGGEPPDTVGEPARQKLEAVVV